LQFVKKDLLLRHHFQLLSRFLYTQYRYTFFDSLNHTTQMNIRSILRFLLPLFLIISTLKVCQTIQQSRNKSKTDGFSSTAPVTSDPAGGNTIVYGGNAQNEGIAGGMPGASPVPSSYDNGNFASKSGEVKKGADAALEELKGNKAVTDVPALSNSPKVTASTSSDDIFSTTPAKNTNYTAKLAEKSGKSTAKGGTTAKKHHTTTIIKKSGKGFLVLAGSFKDHAHAEEQLEKLQKMGYKSAEIVKFEKTDFETVCVAKFKTEGAAKKLDADLEKAKIDAYVHAKK
jgi:cell division septation protein DedD